MKTAMSSEENASGGSRSNDVPRSTGRHSNIDEGKKSYTKDNHHSSPRKKFVTHDENNIYTLDNFQTLTSTKQNVELFKILTAIALEIDGLQKSTEKRFSLLESLVGTIKDEQQVVSTSVSNLAAHDQYQPNKAHVRIIYSNTTI